MQNIRGLHRKRLAREKKEKDWQKGRIFLSEVFTGG